MFLANHLATHFDLIPPKPRPVRKSFKQFAKYANARAQARKAESRKIALLCRNDPSFSFHLLPGKISQFRAFVDGSV